MQNFSNYLSDISLITYLAAFFGGLVTSFTPCIYPLIPIVVGVIGSAKESSRGKNFILSFSYVIGMAFTFSILGVIAALTGKLFGRVQSNPLAYLIVGSIVVLFGLVLLDIIRLPLFLISRAGAGRVVKKRSMWGVFFMGIASGFVATPCAAAVLGSLLAYVATTQNIIFGFSLLFTFATGLGTLLIVVGTFSGILANLPKSDKWMQIIQRGIAALMLLWGGYFIYKAWILRI